MLLQILSVHNPNFCLLPYIRQAVIGKYDPPGSPPVGSQSINITLGIKPALLFRQKPFTISETAPSNTLSRGKGFQEASLPSQLLRLLLCNKIGR